MPWIFFSKWKFDLLGSICDVRGWMKKFFFSVCCSLHPVPVITASIAYYWWRFGEVALAFRRLIFIIINICRGVLYLCRHHGTNTDAMVHWLHGYMPYHLQLETINEAISRAGTIYHPSLFVIQNLVFFSLNDVPNFYIIFEAWFMARHCKIGLVLT